MKSERIEVLWRGLLAGLIGYATVAVVMAAANVIVGRSPFYTAALLGGSLFYGLTDPASVQVWAGPVLAYNGLHLLIFLGLGMIAAWLAHEARRGPHFWYIGAVVMAFVVFHLFGLMLLLTQPVRSALSGWSLIPAGVAALVAMAAYLVRVSPGLRAELRDFAAQDPDLAETTR